MRIETERRLLDGNWLTYDDLLIRLRATLLDPGRGPAACERLRQRYKIVLVDEFQDTDPVQWAVFERAFGAGETTLVLIGDPKQAIYAFRGADVFTYLQAVKRADRRYTLTENWRSDADLLAAYDAFFDPLKLGHADIAYRKVTATPAHSQPGLIGALPGALRVRVVDSHDLGLALTTKTRTIVKGVANDFIAWDLADDVVKLLGRGARLVEHDETGVETSREVAPGHIAVLVRTNRQAAEIHTALRHRGVPAVVAGSENVLATESARHWLRFLEALENPSDTAKAAAVAIGPWLGWSAEKVAGAEDSAWEDLHTRLHVWADVLRRYGVAALYRAVVTDEGLPGRMLAMLGGERILTDLAHIAQLLHAEASAHQLGLHALTAWLHRRIDDAGAGADEAEERSRRLDSDADAVQVLTIHRAKGLEFPIVYCPYLWDAIQGGNDGNPVLFHEMGSDEERKLDIGGNLADNPKFGDHTRLALAENRGEDLRLMYVALTRAEHQAVIWWARVYGCEASGLGRLLLVRDEQGDVGPKAKHVPKDADAKAAFVALAAPTQGLMSVEHCSEPGVGRWQAEASRRVVDLAAARFDRELDLLWRRSSYSSITAAAHDERIGSEPEQVGLADEPGGEQAPSLLLASVLEGEQLETLQSRVCLLADTPGGTEVGTFVHSVLSRVDFAAADLEEALHDELEAEHSRLSTNLGDEEVLVRGLAAAIRTPLGPLVGDRSLSSFALTERLDEMSFELPIAGGDTAMGRVAVSEIASLLSRHLPAPGLLAGYGGRMAAASLAPHIKGYLTGSIDLIFRVPSSSGLAGDDRYFVVDYKTNFLGTRVEPLTAFDYRPEALDAEMQHVHYPVQAVLYMAALHRYLRWRMPDYDPEKNLGGALYLFIRGMLGGDTPAVGGVPCGVFSWDVPTALVTDLSDLLDAGSAVTAQ